MWKIRLPTSGLDLSPAGTHCMVARILVSSILDVSKQHTFFPMLFQCWASVADACPTFMQHWVDVSCLLENRLCHLVLIPLHIKHVAWKRWQLDTESRVAAERDIGFCIALSGRAPRSAGVNKATNREHSTGKSYFFAEIFTSAFCST